MSWQWLSFFECMTYFRLKTAAYLKFCLLRLVVASRLRPIIVTQLCIEVPCSIEGRYQVSVARTAIDCIDFQAQNSSQIDFLLDVVYCYHRERNRQTLTCSATVFGSPYKTWRFHPLMWIHSPAVLLRVTGTFLYAGLQMPPWMYKKPSTMLFQKCTTHLRTCLTRREPGVTSMSV